MSNKNQKQYNQAIDNLTYLVLNYPKPIEELLSKHAVLFQGKPTKTQLINEVIELLKDGNPAFTKSLELLIQRFSSQEHDQFWGIIAKSAVGILGGIFKKKKRGGGGNNAAAAQAAVAKRDMEMRMQRMREAQERNRRERERRRIEAKAKKKTNMMLMIGGGVLVLGIGAVVLMKSGRPPMPYGQPMMQIPR